MLIVSLSVSPLVVEEERGSEKPTTLPPRRIIAVENDRLVRARRLIEQTAEHLAAAGVYIALGPVDDVGGELVQIVEFLVGQIAQIDNMTHGELHPFHVFCFISYHSRA